MTFLFSVLYVDKGHSVCTPIIPRFEFLYISTLIYHYVMEGCVYVCFVCVSICVSVCATEDALSTCRDIAMNAVKSAFLCLQHTDVC